MMCALRFNKPIFCANQEKRENGKDLIYHHCLGRCQLPWPSKVPTKVMNNDFKIASPSRSFIILLFLHTKKRRPAPDYPTGKIH